MKKLHLIGVAFCVMVMVFGILPSASAMTINAVDIVQTLSLPIGETPVSFDTGTLTGWAGSENSNAQILAEVAMLLPGECYEEEIYKYQNDDKEFGDLAPSYDVTRTNGNNWDLLYDGGPYLGQPPTAYLLVKDGNAMPNWYLIALGSWNGTETIHLTNFFTDADLLPGITLPEGYNNGSISHISLLGCTVVPIPGAALLLGSGLVGLVGIRMRYNFKRKGS